MQTNFNKLSQFGKRQLFKNKISHMQRLLSIAVAGSYLLTNPLTQVMYAVAFAVYHLCAKNILFYCLNLNLNRKYKKFQLHTILTKKIWILYSNEKLYSYSNSSQKSKILTLAQPIIAQPIIIIIIIHWCCNYLIFYFCSISSLSIPN